jgi:hypothetical protein
VHARGEVVRHSLHAQSDHRHKPEDLALSVQRILRAGNHVARDLRLAAKYPFVRLRLYGGPLASYSPLIVRKATGWGLNVVAVDVVLSVARFVTQMMRPHSWL